MLIYAASTAQPMQIPADLKARIINKNTLGDVMNEVVDYYKAKGYSNGQDEDDFEKNPLHVAESL